MSKQYCNYYIDKKWNAYLSSDAMIIISSNSTTTMSSSFTSLENNKDKITLFQTISIQIPALNTESLFLLFGGDDNIL